VSDTSTPAGARAHARAQAASEAALVRVKPTLPARDARDLPAGVPRDRLVWDETLGAGGYASRLIERGCRVRIDDLEGGACVGLLAYNADQTAERLNLADTVKVQWQVYLGPGSLLLSDMGRVLLSILEDASGRHDALCGTSSPRSLRNDDASRRVERPNGRDRFVLALARHGLTKRDLSTNLNLFKRVAVGADGSLSLERPPPSPSHVVLRAEMRVLLVVVNVAHVLEDRPDPPVTPARFLAWRGPRTAADDPVRTSTPERLRAFQNVEDLYGDPGEGGA